jgi:hypothetical protein
MIRVLSWTLVLTASVGLVNVPHAIFYEHPELIYRRYIGPPDEHSG